VKHSNDLQIGLQPTGVPCDNCDALDYLSMERQIHNGMERQGDVNPPRQREAVNAQFTSFGRVQGGGKPI